MFKSQELVNRLLLQRQRHVVDLKGLKSSPVEACGLFVCVPSAKPRGPSRNNTPSRPTVEHTVPLAVIGVGRAENIPKSGGDGECDVHSEACGLFRGATDSLRELPVPKR